MKIPKLLAPPTPASAAGIAIICCVLGVLAAQMAAREWRAAEEARTRLDEGDLVRVEAGADAARARARAEAWQLISTALLALTAAVALYATAPGLPTEGIGLVAVAGAFYLCGDALLSARAELKRIGDDEQYAAFKARSHAQGLDAEAAWAEFALERPKTARRLRHRKIPAND